MKRKFITNTYLRDVPKYQTKLYMDEEDYYICVKKFIKVDKKFIIKDGLCVIDDNYYVLEVMPKNENYAIRLFYNDKKEPLEYYFDICRKVEVDSNTCTPYCDDLYLDITYLFGDINILDEDEFSDACKNGELTSDDYELVLNVKEKLLEELRNGTNKYINTDFRKYLFD